MRISIKKLLENIVSPVESAPWCEDITIDEVIKEYKAGNFAKQPILNSETKSYHTKRVAYFLHEIQSKKIEIDVGCPSLGFFNDDLICDGWHRIFAAIILGRKTMWADVCGENEYAKELLGV